MGSLDDRSMHEFEDESLFTPEAESEKIQRVHGLQNGSVSGDFPSSGNKILQNSVCRSIKTVVFSNKLNLLMPFGPLAIMVHNLTGHKGWVFFLSLLGITPLAERLGYATEQLTFFTGATVGGLLNATFGNATELIISIYALKSGMIRVVQLSLLGSILSNMLLVLGCAFFCGGLICCKKEQVFNKASAVVNSGLLLMAVMGLVFPAVLHYTHTEVHFGKSELALSRFSSCIMLVAYGAYLFFQLRGQTELYVPLSEDENQTGNDADHGGNHDDNEAPEISKWESLIWLAIMTAWISILSQYLVDAIEPLFIISDGKWVLRLGNTCFPPPPLSVLCCECLLVLMGASATWNIPISFISVILLPIVGNAAEHASAIMFAMKDKLDISLGVAIGSSTQISMFGIPFCVVIGWIMGRPMDLNFQLFETATLFITVIVVAFFLQEGTSNYFKGLMLILCYLIVAASFFVHEDPTSGGTICTALAHIITGVIGAGVLSLAWSMAQLGWIAGPLCMIAFASVTIVSSSLLCDCYRFPDPEVGPNRIRSFTQAVKLYLGDKNQKVCGIFVQESLYGAGITYTFTTANCLR
ncbi:vacuolar cation/proton exchanger 5 [Citrus sinensis]|nr:vacuolar cation/proton exchanger 5 [Citrus sinensis]